MLLDPLVKPRSVAIVGATDRVGPGRSVVESLGAIGFTGAVLLGVLVSLFFRQGNAQRSANAA